MPDLSYIAEPLRGLAVPIGTLNLDAANARKHPERNLEVISASLSRWGQRAPLVVQREGMIVRAGNGRLIAAKSLGWSHVAAIVVDESSVEATAFAIADNRSAELAEWDEETLASLLKSLPEPDLSGFNEQDVAELLAGLTPEVAEDESPEPLPDPVSRMGDLWELGVHRLLCGDSTKAEDVGKCLGGVRPFLMVTDPPYGVEYDADWRNHALRSDGTPITGRAIGKVINDDRADWTSTWKLFPGAVAYVWHSGLRSAEVFASLHNSDFVLRSQLIWAKNHHVISRGHYHGRHEPCFYAVRRGHSSQWCGDRSQSTLWSIDKPAKSETGHSTQKPVECMARPIRNHDAPEVYDPFLGSGTTLIACEQLGRRCFALEIEPRYVDVAVRRWQNLTGRDATLEGKTWAQVAEERGVCV